jgi:hypothetical protein
MAAYTPDPWRLRDAYIDVILDRSRPNIERFLAQHVNRPLSSEDKNKALRCLEIQRNALLMYTSCGWFFDDISGIETVQIIKYAARAIQLIRRVTGEDLELGFIEVLGHAKSNVPEANNGARIYKAYVEPSIVDILRVGAHYAMSSLYREYPKDTQMYCFSVHREAYEKQSVGKLELVVGKAGIVSEITWSAFRVYFVVLHLGDHNFICGVDYLKDEAAYERMREDIFAVFAEGDIPRTIQAVNRAFGAKNYSLWHLFKHEQQVILEQIFESTMRELDASFRRIYDDHYSLVRMINENHIPLPKALANVVEFVLQRDLVRLLEEPEIPLDRLARVVREISRWQFKRDKEVLELLAGGRLNELMARLAQNVDSPAILEYTTTLLRILADLHLEIDFWKAQNIYYRIAQESYRKNRAIAVQGGQEAGDERMARWVKLFDELGALLKVQAG